MFDVDELERCQEVTEVLSSVCGIVFRDGTDVPS